MFDPGVGLEEPDEGGIGEEVGIGGVDKEFFDAVALRCCKAARGSVWRGLDHCAGVGLEEPLGNHKAVGIGVAKVLVEYLLW